MIREIFASLDLTPGIEYCSARHNCQNSVVIVCVGQEAHSLQEMIAYKVLSGRDAGKFVFCKVMDFARRFQRVRVEPEPAMKEVITADMTDGGKGW